MNVVRPSAEDARPGPAVRSVTTDDADHVTAIYNHYIQHTIVTFEEELVADAEMARRISDVRADGLPWLVAGDGEELLGYAYASRWRTRRAYRFAAEVTAYVSPEHGARGIGSMLYAQLLAELRDGGLHAAMGGIALPNESSVALHEKFGFRKVAHLAEVGFKLGRWIDVGYWQLLL